MSLARPEHPLRVATVVVVAIVVVNLAIWAGHTQVNGPAQRQRPVQIQQLFPQESDLQLPQGVVGADLENDYTGQLTIDHELIPQDQITGDPNLGEVLFAPGPGKDIRELSKGAHNAVIEFWPRRVSTPEEARARHLLGSYSWSFSVG